MEKSLPNRRVSMRYVCMYVSLCNDIMSSKVYRLISESYVMSYELE